MTLDSDAVPIFDALNYAELLNGSVPWSEWVSALNRSSFSSCVFTPIIFELVCSELVGRVWQMLNCVDALMLQAELFGMRSGDVGASPFWMGSGEASMSFVNVCHQAEDALAAAEAEFGMALLGSRIVCPVGPLC
jgi:hypothetical protein